MTEFLEDGDKVRISMRFRGREMDHIEVGQQVLDRVEEALKDLTKIEQFPKREGKRSS